MNILEQSRLAETRSQRAMVLAHASGIALLTIAAAALAIALIGNIVERLPQP